VSRQRQPPVCGGQKRSRRRCSSSRTAASGVEEQQRDGDAEAHLLEHADDGGRNDLGAQTADGRDRSQRLVYISSSEHRSGRASVTGIDWIGRTPGSYPDSKPFITTLAQEWLATSDDTDARTSSGYWDHQHQIEPHPALHGASRGGVATTRAGGACL
jgi:hypothetical protein